MILSIKLLKFYFKACIVLLLPCLKPSNYLLYLQLNLNFLSQPTKLGSGPCQSFQRPPFRLTSALSKGPHIIPLLKTFFPVLHMPDFLSFKAHLKPIISQVHHISKEMDGASCTYFMAIYHEINIFITDQFHKSRNCQLCSLYTTELEDRNKNNPRGSTEKKKHFKTVFCSLMDI